MWPQGKDSSEPINDFDELEYVNYMRLYLYVRIKFVFRRKSIGPVGITRGRCLEKLDAVISILLGTDDTTQLLWSLKPHYILNYKFTAWNIHYSSYDLFIPLQFSDSLFRSCQFVSIKNVVSCMLGHTPIVEHCLVMCSSANQR